MKIVDNEIYLDFQETSKNFNWTYNYVKQLTGKKKLETTLVDDGKRKYIPLSSIRNYLEKSGKDLKVVDDIYKDVKGGNKVTAMSSYTLITSPVIQILENFERGTLDDKANIVAFLATIVFNMVNDLTKDANKTLSKLMTPDTFTLVKIMTPDNFEQVKEIIKRQEVNAL